MSSAAERAAEVLEASIIAAEARADNARWWVEEGVAALMADPDLLVDLAIEAGGLRKWGAWLTLNEGGKRVCNHPSETWCGRNGHTVYPLYRRREATDG